MEVFVGITLFVLGALIASFIGVVVARLHTGQSFLTGRSRCDACDAPLTHFSLVPIISHLISGGRAQCCGAHISFLCPLTEIMLGGLFVGAYLTLGISLAFFCMLVSLALLLALVLYDLTHQILPTPLLALFIGASALTGHFSAPSLSAFIATLPTTGLIAFSLLAIHVLSGGRAMGFADAPFVLGLSLLVGPSALSGFIFSFWIGAVVGIVLLAGRPRGSRMGVEVPFAPFLATGFLLAYFTEWNPFTLIAMLTP